MTSINLRHTYTSSEDVVARCVRRRSAFNTFNKQMTTANQSAEFARSQMLQRKGLGGTTIFITLEEEATMLGSPSESQLNATNVNPNNANNVNANENNQNVTSSSGLNYISKCPTLIRKKPIAPLSNKF